MDAGRIPPEATTRQVPFERVAVRHPTTVFVDQFPYGAARWRNLHAGSRTRPETENARGPLPPRRP